MRFTKLAASLAVMALLATPALAQEEGIGARGDKFTISVQNKPQIVVRDGQVDFLGRIRTNQLMWAGEIWATDLLRVFDENTFNSVFVTSSPVPQLALYARSKAQSFFIQNAPSGLTISAYGHNTGSGQTAMIINDNGNIVIGEEPYADVKLEVEGEVKISTTGTACNAETEGAIRYVKERKRFQGCDGTAWRNLRMAADAVSN